MFPMPAEPSASYTPGNGRYCVARYRALGSFCTAVPPSMCLIPGHETSLILGLETSSLKAFRGASQSIGACEAQCSQALPISYSLIFFAFLLILKRHYAGLF